MYLIFLILSLVINILVFYFVRSPLGISLLILLLTLHIGLTIKLIILNWVFYSFIIIFFRGIIVVFVYISSLGGITKFEFNQGKFTKHLLLLWLRSAVLYYIFIVPGKVLTQCFPSPINFYREFNLGIYLFIYFMFILILFISVKISRSLKGSLKL